jgi:hypothetical protein
MWKKKIRNRSPSHTPQQDRFKGRGLEAVLPMGQRGNNESAATNGRFSGRDRLKAEGVSLNT